MKPPKRNGSPDVEFYGSPLPADALRILAGLTPAELRAGARRMETLCVYNGKDEADAIRFVKTLLRAAGVCR